MIRNVSRAITLALIFSALAAIGSQAAAKDDDAPAIKFPKPDEVASIRIEAAERFLDGPFDITLTKPEEIEPIIKWLNEVDWDPAKSKDARVIRVAPAANIKITPHEGEPQLLLFSDALVIVRSRYWRVETKQFAEVVKKVRGKE